MSNRLSASCLVPQPLFLTKEPRKQAVPQNKSFPLGFPWRSSGQDPALPLQGAQIQSLVGELRSRKPRSTAKKKSPYQGHTPTRPALTSPTSSPATFPHFRHIFIPLPTLFSSSRRLFPQIPTWLVPRRLQVSASASFPVRPLLTTLYKMSQPDIRCCNQTGPSFGPIPDQSWSATPPLGQSECSARHALLHTRTPASLTPAAPSAFSPQHYHWQHIYLVPGCLMPLLLKCTGSFPVSCTTVPPTRRTGPGKQNRTTNGRVNE